MKEAVQLDGEVCQQQDLWYHKNDQQCFVQIMDHLDQKVFRDGTDILHHGDIHPEYMLRSFFISSQYLP